MDITPNIAKSETNVLVKRWLKQLEKRNIVFSYTFSKKMPNSASKKVEKAKKNNYTKGKIFSLL